MTGAAIRTGLAEFYFSPVLGPGTGRKVPGDQRKNLLPKSEDLYGFSLFYGNGQLQKKIGVTVVPPSSQPKDFCLPF